MNKYFDVKDKVYNWNETKYYEVPNVVGMLKEDAIKELKNFKVVYSGSGKYVKEQSPNVGEKIKEGARIRILLGD